MRLRNAGGYSQRRMEKAAIVKEAASNSLHILANGGTRGMATKIHKEGTTVEDVRRLKLGRAATKLNNCSKEKGKETLRNFLFFFNFGATRVTWRRHGATAATKIHKEG